MCEGGRRCRRGCDRASGIRFTFSQMPLQGGSDVMKKTWQGSPQQRSTLMRKRLWPLTILGKEAAARSDRDNNGEHDESAGTPACITLASAGYPFRYEFGVASAVHDGYSAGFPAECISHSAACVDCSSRHDLGRRPAGSPSRPGSRTPLSHIGGLP